MKLDKKAFAINTFAEADNNRADWFKKTPQERIVAAWKFSCRMYHVNPDNLEDIKLDRSYFKVRRRK